MHPFQLSTDIHFDETVQPVCLSGRDANTDGWVTGWRRSADTTPWDTDMSQTHVNSWIFDPTVLDYAALEVHENAVSVEGFPKPLFPRLTPPTPFSTRRALRW